jgi:hypothetical protein
VGVIWPFLNALEAEDLIKPTAEQKRINNANKYRRVPKKWKAGSSMTALGFKSIGVFLCVKKNPMKAKMALKTKP